MGPRVRGYRFLFLGTCPGETRTQSLGLERSWAGSDQPLPTTGLSVRSLVLILCIYGSLQQSRKWCSYHLSMYSVLYCCIQETTQSCSLPTFKEYMYFFKNRDDRDFAATNQQYFSLTLNQHQPRTSTSQPTILFSRQEISTNHQPQPAEQSANFL